MSSSLLSPEARLLLLTAGDASNDPAIRRELHGVIDWRRLIALAEIERAMPVMVHRLRAVASDVLPPEVSSVLWRHGQVAEFRMAHLATRVDETLARLGEEGVEVVLLKGAAVVATAYGSFTARPMGDVDVLIRSPDVGAARRAAERARWTPTLGDAEATIYDGHHHLPPLADALGAGFALELHTDVMMPGHPFGLTTTSVWERREERRLGDRVVLVPRPVDQLLHACIHFAWGHMLHGGAWRTFRDVASLVERGGVTWEELVPLARETRAATCCYWTFRLAQMVAGVRVPEAVMRELAPGLSERVMLPLERHAVDQLLASERRCPSVRLRQRMWAAAIRPARSGHGDSRPWSRAEEWRAFTRRDDQRPSIAARMGAWSRYARLMLGGSGA